jgi:hypothetical protein
VTECRGSVCCASQLGAGGWADGQKDMTKLTVAFRNSANTSKKNSKKSPKSTGLVGRPFWPFRQIKIRCHKKQNKAIRTNMFIHIFFKDAVSTSDHTSYGSTVAE